MNFLTADVAIKVDDKQLPAQLAKVKSAVTRTVDKIKASFSKMATSFKAAFDKMVKIAKWGALAISIGLGLATKAAMRQEDAIFGLVAALKVAGEYTPKVTRRLIDFASAMQKVTIFGDEATIEQMAYASALGVSADKMEESMKAAMGLAVITKSLETATMLVARAAGGQTQMLTRYGIMLDESLSPQEKFNALLLLGAGLFELATAKAETTSGTLKQMWSAIGDVSEVIGAAFLPAIKAAATAIKIWAENNQEQIGRWSKIVVAHIAFVKDILMTFASYLKDDWKVGVGVGLNVVIELFIGFGDMVFIIMKHAMDRLVSGELWDPIRIGFVGRLAFMREKMRLTFEHPLSAILNDEQQAANERAANRVANAAMELERRILRVERSNRESAGPPSTLDRKLAVSAAVTLGRIEAIIPPEVMADFEADAKKLQATLDALKDKADTSTTIYQKLIETMKAGASSAVDTAKKYGETIVDTLVSARATYMEHLQQKVDAAKKAEEQIVADAIIAARALSRDQVREAEAGIKHIQSLNFLTHTERLDQMDELIEIKRGMWAEESDAMAILADERQRYAEQHKEGWEAVRQTMDIWFQDAVNWGKNLGDVLARSFDRVADSFADMLMNQKADWKAFGAMFIKELLSMIMQLYIAVALKAALQGWAGLGQSAVGSGGAIPTSSFGGGTGPAAIDTGFASGGSVLQTGIVKVHKGEEIVPAGGGGLTVNVIDNVGVQVAVEENPDERTYNVVLTALEGDGPMRRAIRSAAGRS